MDVPKRFDRKLFLTWTLSSTSAFALGCSAADPGSPPGGAGGSGGTGGGVSGSGGAAGSFSGSSFGGGTAGSGGAAGAGGATGGGGAGGGAPIAPDCSAQLKVFITSNHEHTLLVTMADVIAAMPKVYDTMGASNHPHWLQLSAADFAKLQTGGTVRKLSCNDGHEHEFIINCVGVAMPNTSSGVANSCDPAHSCADTNTNFCPELPE